MTDKTQYCPLCEAAQREIAELKRLVMKLYYCISPSALTCELSADDSIVINKIVGELCMSDNKPTIVDNPDQDFVELWRRHIKFFTQGYSPEIQAFEVALCKIEAAIERELALRKIASYVPGAIYIKAKEDSGYGEAVRAKEERGEAMTEAKTNKEFIAKARQAAEFVDPPAAVHGCLDRLEAAEKEIARLRGLIARYHERINGRIPTAIPSFGWGSEHDVWEAVEQIVKEERGIL